MNKILLTVIIGAAVAGVVYYLYDREGAEKLMADVKDAASDALEQITDHISKVGEDAANAMQNA
ncbi:MAG TPA: YtxH domain-containing protein [Flavisolibacter sp.]|jgi:hypothetical protein|nr:YtxH domain-containing protein [Flavisolibacter sp.]